MGVINPIVRGPLGGSKDREFSIWNGVLRFTPSVGAQRRDYPRPLSAGPGSSQATNGGLLPDVAASSPAGIVAQTGSLQAGENRSVLDDEQIAKIVFREAQSLRGKDALATRVALARTIMNADARWGEERKHRAGTQPPTLPPDLTPEQQRIYRDTLDAVSIARAFDWTGMDPVNGATNFNMRNRKSERSPYWGRGLKPEDVLGPIPNSAGPDKYVYIWK